MAGETAPTVLPARGDNAGLWETVFESSDVDLSRVHMSGMLCPHRLDHRGPERLPLFRHRHARFGGLCVHELDYTMFGGDAFVRVPELADIFLIELNLAGCSTFYRDNETADFAPGEICVINAGQRHLKRWCTDGRQMFIRISQPRLNTVLTNLIERPLDAPLRFETAPRPVDGWLASLAQVVRLIYSELEHGPAGMASLRAAESAERLLLELMLETMPHNYSAVLERALLGVSEGPKPAHVRRAVEFLHAQAGNPISVTEVAAAAGTPVRSLQRGFQEAYGVSPMTYLRNLRLDRARAALLDGGRQVTEVALDSGFQHLGKFAQAYRERFGETPSATLAQSR